MQSYLDLLQKILDGGEARSDRTGTGTLSLFGEHLSFDLAAGFPLLTTKKMPFKQIADEMRWFLSGSTNIEDLPERTRHWWAPWADASGDLGPIYGHQWRNASAQALWDPNSGETYFRQDYGTDQLQTLIDGLKTDPFSRRHVVTMWAPNDVKHQRLPCCHGTVIQFYVSKEGKLSCHMMQRSADFFIGAPVNIASYALLTMMLCQTHDFNPGKLHISYGDVHLYANHIEQAREQMTREPKVLPVLDFTDKPWHEMTVLDMQESDFILTGYDPWPSIKAPVSV